MSGNVFTTMTTSPGEPAPDPTKHINYVLGMVLGVDDFTQEFAYLSGRNELAARELGGCGVVRGLRVSTMTDAAKGPEVVVSAGLAITPSGRFVRVPLTQCALLNEWIAKNKADKLTGIVPPATISLFVALSYREQTTDLVPIPGEPCRTEDESMAASRVADDFKLELLRAAPEQREEDAIRLYLDWLATIPIVDSGAPALDTFLGLIADGAAKAPQPVVPSAGAPPTPVPPGTAIFGAPPPVVSIPRSGANRYLREAVRLFPTLRAAWMGAGASPEGIPPNEQAVLLAEVKVAIVVDSLVTDVWKVSDALPIVIDESRRSRVLSLAYIQEALFAVGSRVAKTAVTHPLALDGVGYVVAAAGTVQIKADESDPAPPGPIPYNGLTAWASNDGEVSVKFAGPSGPGIQYIVKALPLSSPALLDPSVAFGAFLPAPPLSAGDAPHFSLRISDAGGVVLKANLVGEKLMIEVSAFGAM